MSELRLNTDGHIIKLGADNDVTLTHVADTGILLNSTMQLQFNDSSQFINAPSATVLDINATDEIELNATAVDLNGTLDVSGTLTQTGVATFSARSVHSSGITIADAGQIGSASDADAIAIASNGVVTFSQNPVFPDGGVAVADLDIDGATDIGAAVVDADLFIIDDGAGGTNRKVTASRLKTYTTPTLFGAGVTDVLMDATNFTNSILIQTSSDGSAPTTGTLSSANDNVGMGKEVFTALTSGQQNTALGTETGKALTTGVNNTFLGYNAGIATTTGGYNVMIGKGAGAANTTASDNIFIGQLAGAANTTGSNNIAIGYKAYDNADTETNNLAIGYNALGAAVNGGEQNIGIGPHVLDALTTGDSNIAIGMNAGTALTTGGNNVIIGDGAVGTGVTTGSFNVVMGANAGAAITGGQKDVIIGHNAGLAVTTAPTSVLIGYEAGKIFATGSACIAIGSAAYDNADAEGNNVAIGLDALGGAVNGAENNVMVGNYTGDAITSGDYNTALGHTAGGAITTGVGNVFLGSGAGAACETAGSNICIGYNANTSGADAADTLVFGGITGASNDFSFGKASNIVSNDFDADADWSRSSDLRLKRNIQDTTLGLDFINDLRPVKFNWKPSYEVPKEMKAEYNEKNQKDLDYISHGFIAQEVKEAIDKHGDTTFGGWHLDKTDNETQRVKKNMFVMPLIKAVQELTAQVSTLQNEVKTLKGE